MSVGRSRRLSLSSFPFAFPVLIFALAGAALAGPAGQDETVSWTLLVSVERAEVRAAPDAGSPVLTWLERGRNLSSYEKMEGWFRVVVKEPQAGVVIGYVAEAQVEATEVKEKRRDFWSRREAAFHDLGLSVKLYGGVSWPAAGDIGRAIRTEFDSRADGMAADGLETTDRVLRDFGTATGISFEVLYCPIPSLGLSVGAGTERMVASNRAYFRRGEISEFGVQGSPTFSVRSLRAGVYGFFPVGRFTAFVHGGAGQCRVRIADGWHETHYTGWTRIDRSSWGSGLEWRAGLGFETALNPRARLFAEGLWRFARLARFEGRETYQDWESYSTWVGRTTEGRLWLVADGDGFRPSIMDGSPPAGLSARPASLNFRSLSLSLGLRLRF